MMETYLIIILFFLAFYNFIIKPLNYWIVKNVKQEYSKWLIKDCLNFILVLLRLKCLAYFVQELYQKNSKYRYFGIYLFNQPILVIRDPELIKKIGISDFENFTDHSPLIPDNDPLWGNNLISLKGKKWQYMRPLVSSSFTISKIKNMFIIMNEKAKKFTKSLTIINQNNQYLEVKSLFSRYSTDIFASTTLSIEIDSMNDADNEFYLIGKEISSINSWKSNLKIMAFSVFPYLFKKLKILYYRNKVRKYFFNIVEDNVKLRKQGLNYKDIIQHLLTVKNKSLNTDTIAEKHPDIKITNTDIAAHIINFFFATYDSTATLMSFMAYELGIHQDIQNKLRNEIQKINFKYNNNLTYEGLAEMKYMDMVVSESLRKWMNFPMTDRICTKEYTIKAKSAEENTVTIDVGTRIWIPIHSIHHDPNYFPEPEKFDPERFSDENKHKITSCTYIPFGLGPRNCIGITYAIQQTKLIFFYILLNFEIDVNKRTKIPVERANTGIGFTSAKGGLHLEFKLIKPNQLKIY